MYSKNQTKKGNKTIVLEMKTTIPRIKKTTPNGFIQTIPL